MAQQQEVTIRRARVSDAGRVAAFVNRGQRGTTGIDEQTVIARLGDVVFLLADLNGDLVGILGWRAENLVARVTDLLIGPVPDRVAVGRALLSEMEQTARELQCEVVLMLLPRPTPPALIEFYEALGYEPRTVANLTKAWREAALEAGIEEDEAVVIKQLRERRVIRPL